MRLRGLIAGLAFFAIAGCDNDMGLPGASGDGGARSDGNGAGNVDLAPAYDPCRDVPPLPDSMGTLSSGFVGPPEMPFTLGGDGTKERDAHVALDGQGAVVLGSSGGLPEVKGSYFYTLYGGCLGSCRLRRVGWTVETPPNTWVNTATRIDRHFDNLDGGGWTPRGGVDFVDVDETYTGGFDVQFDVELFSGANDAGSPVLRRLYICWEN